jgi:heavy metal sensor kinase
MRVWPSSLRSRLTLWYTALLALPLITFAVVVYIIFAQALSTRTDRFIGDALSAFSRELGAERRAAGDVAQAMRTTVDEVRFTDLHIAIFDGTRHVVASTAVAGDTIPDGRPSPRVITRVVAVLQEHDLAKPIAVNVPTSDGDYRVVARPLVIRGQSFTLTGTYSLLHVEEMLQRIRRVFVVVIPLLILCAATGGYFLAGRSLAPVSAMTARAAAISATNLHERLPIGGGDELVGLARVVNDLLERLEVAFEQQRRFMADASHELRTPTAILRTEADVTLSRDHRTEDEYRASMTVIQDAARRLTRIVEDLFLLARADSGNLVARHEPLYLDEIVDDTVRGVRQVAERRDVRISIRHTIEAPLDGDADLLGRLLLNLLDNAIKHSPEGGTVDVGMSRTDGRYEIAVIDAGAGIPAEARDRVFERFFRVDAARSRGDATATGGAGLGLAIARRIAELHGGGLDLIDSRPGRTEFRLTLPSPSSS